MDHALRLALLALLVPALPVHCEDAKTVKLSGWFSDEHCARARLTAPKLGPSNPVCSADCIRKGAAPVFIGEDRAILVVKNYPGVIDDLGFQVEVTGIVDSAAKTLRVQSVKQLSWEGAACVRPRKPATAPHN
jgi:hypothetical protein